MDNEYIWLDTDGEIFKKETPRPFFLIFRYHDKRSVIISKHY